MNILVTGARGFVGKNLCESLKNIRDGKDHREQFQKLLPLTVFEYDVEGTEEELGSYCAQADFVFNLAGVNRPEHASEYMEGNAGFAEKLLAMLEQHGNTCPVMLASSTQASLEGRFAGSAYGESKLAAEQAFHDYAKRTGANVLIYRFPNLYGKWCLPNYNSAVATFCHNIANDLPITVNDSATELELLYIDDLVAEMLAALLGCENRVAGNFCEAAPTDRATLGQVVDLLYAFKADRQALCVQDMSDGSFSKKLCSTYLSYCSPLDCAYKLKENVDERGAFIEFLRTPERGQISVNVSKPGFTKGQHWHHTKWEKFLVVSGQALIQLRRVGVDEAGNPYPVVEYRVSADEPTVVEALPGYTHNIINLSDEHDLVTLAWANEAFDPERPDTYREEV